MNKNNQDSLGVLLKWHFERKLAKNPSYSLRAFARDLGIPASNLSDVLNQKRKGFSESNIQKICLALKLNDNEKRSIINHSGPEASSFIKEMKSTDFEVISKPKFLTVLCLTHLVKTFKITIENASRIGLGFSDLRTTVDTLVKHGALKKNEDHFIPTGNFFVNPKETKSIAIQDFHHEILKEAGKAITEQPVPQREFNVLVFPSDTKSLEKMKERIREFKNQFENEFGIYINTDEHEANSIHALCIQLFRMDKINN